MATLENVRRAVEDIAPLARKNNWIEWKITHVEKKAYSIVFFKDKGDDNDNKKVIRAIRTISAVQKRIFYHGWNFEPLVLVFPISNYRLNVFVPNESKVRGSHIMRVRGVPLRSYRASDKRTAATLEELIRKEEGALLSNTLHESLAAVAWNRFLKPECVARNVEVTIPTPYPDPIRTRTRALRDYGVTVEEFDGIAVKSGRIVLMEAKAANGGNRHWENIVRRKIRAYLGALAITNIRNVRVDFVVTGNSELVAKFFARRAKDETRSVPAFSRGKVLAVWAKNRISVDEV